MQYRPYNPVAANEETVKPSRSVRSNGYSRHRSRGQSLVEFAVMAIPLLLLLSGLIDMGVLFEKQVMLTNAARAGGRYASLHPTALSNAASAPSNTIQGQIQLAGDSSGLPNDDTHFSITYYPNGSTAVCGTYQQSTGTVTYAAGYTQATCLGTGGSVKVQVTNTYPLITPLISALYSPGVKTTAIAAFLISSYP
jgi:Flp pilus assembly protein TadG